ncbi:sonic hedgehog protein [Neocloeon triangulifer]|uniref:sonic hedgehog protein n=1 Tax=Neocloeon triangulifer TaxID=2078957 RepID=UPI00286F06B9|nr:sonic hedgehog protein [Neocloeon triangulifer]
MSVCVGLSVLLLLLGPGPLWACGPGRGGHRVKTPRKLTPLVFMQHIPNMSENTLGASGLAEGKITRQDPRFAELEPNYNSEIIYRDEEGTGADRLMTERLKEKVNTLAISVMNQWPGVKLRVTEGWQEEGILHTQREILHYEGRAVDITTSDRDRSKLGMLARLAVEAGFDWVHYESKSHIHCSVKSESSHSAKSGGCFTADTTVVTSDGHRLPLAELQVGQQVLTFDPQTGRTQYSEVLLWLDRDPDEDRLFVEISTEGGRRLAVTPNHLLLVRRPHGPQAVYAGNVEKGDELLGLDSSSMTSDAVVSVRAVRRRGVFAPLTTAGTLVVDGVGASCYAVVASHPLAHAVFAPFRLLSNAQHAARALWSSAFGGAAVDARSTPPQPVGVHWYAQGLYWVAQRVLPQGMLS